MDVVENGWNLKVLGYLLSVHQLCLFSLLMMCHWLMKIPTQYQLVMPIGHSQAIWQCSDAKYQIIKLMQVAPSGGQIVLAVPALFCLRQCIAQKFASQRGQNCVIKGVFCISPGETAAPASAGCPLLGVEATQGELLLLPQPDAPPVHSLEGILNKFL